jgi:hypothetical protein
MSNLLSGNPLLIAEFTVIASVVLVQIYFFFSTTNRIALLRKTFEPLIRIYSPAPQLSTITSNEPDSLKSELAESEGVVDSVIPKESKTSEEDLDIGILITDKNHKVNYRIATSINSYLKNNVGTVINYSIIKDIVDRETDAINEDINNSIPVPLYLGLSATIIGIIFGLFAMPSLAVQDVGLEPIDILINGVKIAMFASLSGLFWTILLSSFIYKPAYSYFLDNKNKQLSYFQERLLPIIYNEDESGIQGLKKSVDNFARKSTTYVKVLEGVAETTSENIVQQNKLLNEFRNININKLTKANIELFNKIESNVEYFNHFITFINLLSDISVRFQKFSEKTENIDIIAVDIKKTLSDSNLLTQFLTKHLEKIETVGSTAISTADESEKRMGDALLLLADITEKNVKSIGELSDNMEKTLLEMSSKFEESISVTTNKSLENIDTVYKESLPKFENLHYLSELKEIKEKIVRIEGYKTASSSIKNNNAGFGESSETKQIVYLLEKLVRQTSEMYESQESRTFKGRRIRLKEYLLNLFN